MTILELKHLNVGCTDCGCAMEHHWPELEHRAMLNGKPCPGDKELRVYMVLVEVADAAGGHVAARTDAKALFAAEQKLQSAVAALEAL